MKKIVFTIVAMLVAGITYAHSGGTDKLGCHYDRSTGVYHCH